MIYDQDNEHKVTYLTCSSLARIARTAFVHNFTQHDEPCLPCIDNCITQLAASVSLRDWDSQAYA